MGHSAAREPKTGRAGQLWRRWTARREAASTDASPDLRRDPDVTALLREAKDLVHAGRADEAAQCLQAALALDPGNVDLLRRLAKLRLQQGRPAEAAAHLEHLAKSEPGDVALWKRLAVCTREIGDTAGETAALRKVLELAPDDLMARDRMATMALDAGEHEEAAGLLRALAEASPDNAHAWAALADCLGHIGDGREEEAAWERALAALAELDNKSLLFAIRIASRLTNLGSEKAAGAWERILAYAPQLLKARAQLEEIRLYGLNGKPAPQPAVAGPAFLRGARPRVLVIGNCQAYALGRQLRAGCPPAEVRTVGLGEAGTLEEANALSRRWPRLDYVVTQQVDLPRYGDLRSEMLKPRAGRMAYFPRIHFRGFHPDLLRAGNAPLGPFPIKGFHSAIIMAAHALGIPEQEVPDLFNAYIYGILGYFDEHSRAELYHIADARRCGVDLQPLLAEWRAYGAWVHVPNHPIVAVFQSVARNITTDLGLEFTEREADPFDDLEGAGVWPVYPGIADRLGFKGGLVFRLSQTTGPIELEEFVARSYRAYAALDPEQVLRGVSDIVGALKAEGL